MVVPCSNFVTQVGPEGSRSDEAWLRDRGVGRVLTVAGHSEHLPRFNGGLSQLLACAS